MQWDLHGVILLFVLQFSYIDIWLKRVDIEYIYIDYIYTDWYLLCAIQYVCFVKFHSGNT